MSRSLRVARGTLLVLAIGASTASLAAELSVADLCGQCRVEKVASCGGFLEGATVAPDGTLWALDLSGDRILNITDKGECAVRGKSGSTPNGAKFAKDGRMFIAARSGLLTFDPKTAAISVVVDSFEGKPLGGLNDLAFDKDGGLYFTIPEGSDVLKPQGRVFYLPPGATAPVLLTDKIAFPNGVVAGPDGRSVLVAEFAMKRVLSMPAANVKGGIAVTYVYANTQGGVGPDGITVDSKGRLFTANLGAGEVLAFSDVGRPLGAIRLPDDAGKLVSNLVVRGEYLYFVEAMKGEVWRVRLEK